MCMVFLMSMSSLLCQFVLAVCILVCFKQKTAYYLRISYWSSDVCSSELRQGQRHHQFEPLGGALHVLELPGPDDAVTRRQRDLLGNHLLRLGDKTTDIGGIEIDRSEEHTSELQSLMRISYAVFCLKKKKKNTKLQNEETATTRTDKQQDEKS